MADVGDLLADGFGRVHEVVHAVVGDLAEDELAHRPDGRTNSVAWLVWHLTRIQDDHVADAFGREQVWTAQGWAERLGLPFPTSATGYGHGPEDVAAVRVPGDLLLGYLDDVHEQTRRQLSTVSTADLDRVVDRGWDPPVTLGVRLVSVLSDDLQHAGQAAYVRGLLEPEG